ncbi:MAG: metal-dependent hydrolase [Acidobacteria bacterium]|nr:metal-dependent hydrolase [Acidobacteriota bacterium]
MDTLSHAAWGVATLRSARKETPAGGSQRRVHWWAAALAGAAPDLLFFVPSRIEWWLARGTLDFPFSAEPGIWREGGPPLPPDLVMAYGRYYVKTHSLVLLAVVCLALWATGRKRWLWLAAPYALHILMDMPTHERYRTQPLWPLSSWQIHGLTWGDPRIFFPHLAILIGVYVWLRKTERI